MKGSPSFLVSRSRRGVALSACVCEGPARLVILVTGDRPLCLASGRQHAVSACRYQSLAVMLWLSRHVRQLKARKTSEASRSSTSGSLGRQVCYRELTLMVSVEPFAVLRAPFRKARWLLNLTVAIRRLAHGEGMDQHPTTTRLQFLHLSTIIALLLS